MPLEPKALSPKKIETTIHLSKAVHDVGRKYKCRRAVKAIVAAGERMMHTKEVKVDNQLNNRIWAHGIQNPPTRIRVQFERVPDAEGKTAHTVARLVGPTKKWTRAEFRSLKTHKVEE